MTPAQAAVNLMSITAQAPNGKIGAVSAPKPDTAGFWDTFWMDVYKVPGTSKAADAVIKVGSAVDTANHAVLDGAKAAAQSTVQVAKAAKTGLVLGLEVGPLLIILGLALYFFGPVILAGRRS